MDEPTSALNMKAEAAIREIINSLVGKVTVVGIAYRILILEASDRLMVTEAGRIASFQTPPGLQNDNDLYRKTLE